MSDQIFDLDGMSAEEITKATADGRLSAMLEGDPIRIAQEQAIAEREAIEAAAEEAKPASVDQGARGTTTHEGQVTAAELATMSTAEIARATAEGRMTDLLS